MEKQITIDDVIKTYQCLISVCEKMPGMRFEETFSDEAVQAIRNEHKWLQICKQAETQGY